MDRILKVIDWIVWLLILVSIAAFIYGIFQVINLMFIRG